MLRLALLASLCYSALAKCPAGFELVRNGECIAQLESGQLTYASDGVDGAGNMCDRYGAIPVVIANQADHDYWVGVAANSKLRGARYGNILLGIYCINYQYVWADGRVAKNSFKPKGYDKALDGKCGETPPSDWHPVTESCMWLINPDTNNWQRYCNDQEPYIDSYCVVPHPRSPHNDKDCSNFDHEKDDDTCYQVGKAAANWTEANTICHSFGANVASIHNDEENEFIRRLAVAHRLVDGMYLGGSLNGKNSAFTWADGSKWDYDKFAPGFPDAGFGACAAMVSNNVGGQWINIDCATELPFACVRPTSHAAPVCDGKPRQENEIIYSPGFPSNASIPCDFVLTVAPGKLVEVEILMLEANSCCDRLVLSEGGNEIKSLTGQGYDGRTFRTTSSNVMTASWQPQGGVHVKGMMITFRAV